MSIRINDPAHALVSFPKRGEVAPSDPSVGTMNRIDWGTVIDMTTSRRAASYFQSDGATANRGLVQGPFVAGSRGWLAGAPVAEWRGTIPGVTSATSTADQHIAGLSPSANPGHPGATGQTLGIYLPANNTALWIQQEGTWNTSSRRVFSHPTFRTVFGGSGSFFLEVLFFKGTTNPIVRVNGVDVSASFTLSTLGTVPDWLDANMLSTYHLTGGNWPSGEIPSGAWINGHLTSAESLAWMIIGQPPAWVQLGGSQASIVADGSAFDTATWVKAYLSVTANATTAPDATNTADLLTEDSAASQQRWVNNSLTLFRAGGIYEMTFFAKTNGRSLYYELGNCRGAYDLSTFTLIGGNSYNAAWSFISHTATSVGSGWYQITVRGQCNITGIYAVKIQPTPHGNAYLGLVYNGDGTSGLYLWGLRTLPIGALSLLTPQAIAVAHDWTEIGGNDARCIGVRGVTEDPNWVITTDTVSNAAGGQAALGGDIFDSTRDVIDSIVQLPTVGTPTTSVGHATGSLATYKASGALASGLNPLTPVTRKLSSNQLWIYQSTTDRLRTTINGRRAN